MNPSEQIDKQIAEFPGWRGEMYSRLRKVINETDPGLKEEFKWNTAVWTKNGLVCALGAFKNHLKINFFRGSHLKDPHGLINAGKDAKEMRSIDFHEGDTINEIALQELIRAAIENNKKR